MLLRYRFVVVVPDMPPDVTTIVIEAQPIANNSIMANPSIIGTTTAMSNTPVTASAPPAMATITVGNTSSVNTTQSLSQVQTTQPVSVEVRNVVVQQVATDGVVMGGSKEATTFTCLELKQ